MRTNIDIDDRLMESAMRAGHFKTKKDAVEAGLALLARQAAFREVLKWEGKLLWDDDEEIGSRAYPTGGSPTAVIVREPARKSPAAKMRHGRR